MTDWTDDSDPDLPFDEDDGGDDSDAVDSDDEGAAATRACPQCGADVYEDAEQCTHCGEWLTRDTSAWQGRPLWWIVLGLLGGGAVVGTLLLP